MKIAGGLIIGVFLLLLIIGLVFAPTSKDSTKDSTTAAVNLKDAPAQDKEWINNTNNNLALVQQTDTIYKNELEQNKDRSSAAYLSKYNKAKDVESIAMQAAGISQQATVSSDLQPVKDNYENYLVHLRLYAAWKAKAWDYMYSHEVSLQNIDEATSCGETGKEEEETANDYLKKYNSGMKDYLKSYKV